MTGISTSEARFAGGLFLGTLLILSRIAGVGGDTEQPRAQSVRLLDVFVFGPLMMYAGGRRSTLPLWTRNALVLLGVGTIVYNGINFTRVYKLSLDSEQTGQPRRRLGDE